MGSIMIEDYEMLSSIGEGSFATVRLAIHVPTKTQVAVKIVSKNNFHDPDHLARFEREINLIRNMDHPYIVEFYDLLTDENNYYVIMEYVSNGNMLDYVNNNGELDENHARRYFSQLICALEYLHKSLNIAHRDLKAENVLLDRNNNLRLIDFGLSNSFSSENPFLKTACGSPAYAAPEMIKGQEYTTACDVWSAGILLYAMVYGELPFEDDNIQKMLQKIIFTAPIYPPNLSDQLQDLLQRMLTKDPLKRITLDKIKEHPWFSKSEYEMMNHPFSRQLRVASPDQPIDHQVVSRMTNLGYDCQSLVNSILNGETSKLTAIYKMLRKEKITNLLVEMQTMSPRNGMRDMGVMQSRTLTSKHIPLPILIENRKKLNEKELSIGSRQIGDFSQTSPIRRGSFGIKLPHGVTTIRQQKIPRPLPAGSPVRKRCYSFHD